MTPRNVRNAWMNAQIDGRGPIATGPVSADGQMQVRFFVRDNGRVIPSVSIETVATRDDRLMLRVFAPDGTLLFEHETTR